MACIVDQSFYNSLHCHFLPVLFQILFTGSTDQTVKSWNIQKGEILRTFEGHQGSVICLIVSVFHL